MQSYIGQGLHFWVGRVPTHFLQNCYYRDYLCLPTFWDLQKYHVQSNFCLPTFQRKDKGLAHKMNAFRMPYSKYYCNVDNVQTLTL